jgi:cell fate regulator YaaT (PSP1 superfamily)
MPRYVLRYGTTRAVGLFSPRGQDRYARGMRVIARTPRGLEAAEVLAEATDEQAKLLESAPGGQIMREMSAEDANEVAHLQEREGTAFETCRKHVARLGLPMQLVDIEHVFGGERIVIYYLSEERVDFRDLVKALASEFQTRIEMRQIGVRDEAKLLADYGDCGQPVCCGTFLSEMPPVSMKMAKVQKATLDPTKISGRCGRLKCCLRYEYDIYEELQQELPPIGSDVVTKNGRARILGQEILAQQLLVAMEDNRRILIPASDVLSVIKAGSGRRPDREERGRRREGESERGRDEERAKRPDEGQKDDPPAQE